MHYPPNNILCNLHTYVIYYFGKKGILGIAYNLKMLSSKLQPVILITFQEGLLQMNMTHLVFLKILKYCDLKASVVLLYLKLKCMRSLSSIEKFALKWASHFQLTSPTSKGITGLHINEVQWDHLSHATIQPFKYF